MIKPSLPKRSLRTTVRSVLAVALGTGMLLSLSGLVGSGTAGATQSVTGSVTYSATLNIPAPPPSNFSGSAGGDGWAVALTPTSVYNVFHHAATLQVNCHLQSNASDCWSGPKTIVDGSGNNFSTSIGPGLYINQTTGKLYIYAVRTSDHTAGVVCVDTTLPASDTGAQLFCGFTQLGGVGDSTGGNANGLSAPVQVGSNWYSFNEVQGVGTGSQNKLLCFSLVSFAACGGQPFAVNDGGLSLSPIGYSYPIGAAGNDVIIQAVGSTDVLACFDTATNGSCSGSWPVTVAGANGSPFPMISSTGTVTGTCLPISGDPCYSLSGASVATPPGMTTAITANIQYNGPAVTIGARVYVANANTDQVDCYDYSAQAQCANFPKSFLNLGLLYTVNTDPQRPTCIWVNSDDGADQIQNFDAYTGGACGTGPTRVLAASLVAPFNECLPSNYTGLQVLVPTPSQYSSGSVQFLDFDGNPIPGIPSQNLDATGSINLTPFNLATASPLPQFLITLNGANNPPEVDVKLTWVGQYSPNCLTGNQTVSGSQGYRTVGLDGGVFSFGSSAFFGSMSGTMLNGPAIGIANSPDDAGYWLAGTDGGVFTFGDAGYYGSLGSQMHLNAPILGIAATPDGKGYWLVAGDGGVFAFGDAGPDGSLGGQTLSSPIVGIAPTPDGGGYWLAGADGNVYPFGDATSYGSALGDPLGGPIVGIASSPDGKGYWLAGSDGGVFAFGDAGFYGSMVGTQLAGPVVGIQPTPDGGGYWLAGSDGGIFALGDAQFLGSMALNPLFAPIHGITG